MNYLVNKFKVFFRVILFLGCCNLFNFGYLLAEDTQCIPGITSPSCPEGVVGLPPGTNLSGRLDKFNEGGTDRGLPYSVRTPFYKAWNSSNLTSNESVKKEEKKDAVVEFQREEKKMEVSKQKEEKRIDIFTKFEAVNATEPKEIEGIYFKITPEKKYYVQLSSIDINRVVCPYEIKSVIFSDERGVMAEIVGNNLFIKYKITKLGEEFIFSETPVDIYIVCGEKIYSIIGVPSRIPGVNVYLIDPEQNIRLSKKWQGMPFEVKITEIIKSVFKGEIPDGAIHRIKNKSYEVNPFVDIVERESFILETEGLEVRVFQLSLKEGVELKDKVSTEEKKDARPLRVKFQDDMILRTEIVKKPLAYAMDSMVLEKGKFVTVVVIEKLSEKKLSY